ncbi:MAG TPA: hypothetical protein VGB30_11000 [bacterium]|jgi:hypothetical protein
MCPRAVYRPTPPKKLASIDNAEADRPVPVFQYFKRYRSFALARGFTAFLTFHYAIIGIFWITFFLSGVQNEQFYVKLTGIYVFYITVIGLPLLFPLLVDDRKLMAADDAALPLYGIHKFDSKLAVLTLGATLTALPSLVMFISVDYLSGDKIDLYGVFPYLQAVISAVWVYILMEISAVGRFGNAISGRFIIIAFFILIHVILVGLIYHLSPQTLQVVKLLKLLIDINPFSQVYILTAGPDANRLLFIFYTQRQDDPREVLLTLNLIVTSLTLLFVRMKLQTVIPR